MEKGWFAALGGMVLLASVAAAQEAGLTDPASRVSYSLGYQVGQDLKRQDVGVEPAALRAGLADGLAGAEPAMAPDAMARVLAEVKDKAVAAQQRSESQERGQHRKEGAAFLAENAKREGVVVLPSGVQYQVLRPGEGRKPGPSDTVSIRYRGTRIDGTEFGSSHRKGPEPRSFRVGALIPGLAEAVQRMAEGAEWKVFIPDELAFGKRTPLDGQTVIYEVELVSVEAADSHPPPETPKPRTP